MKNIDGPSTSAGDGRLDNFLQISSEEQLTSIAESVLNPECAPFALEPVITAVERLVRAGHDPLGDAFLALRSPESRRDLGAVYTPEFIVHSMMQWAASVTTPSRIIDPGTGSGRFSVAAAKLFPKAKIIACDVDPLALLLLQANAKILKFDDRLEARLVDFRLLDLPKISGPTLYIGNPPYVRHHNIDPASKTWFAETAMSLGFKASKLAGLHVYFFLRTRQIAQPGDYGAYITSAEWMDVNYGSVMREMLADGLGGRSLHVFPADGMPFQGTMTTGAITTFNVGKRSEHFTVQKIDDLADLQKLEVGEKLSWEAVQSSSRWTQLFHPQAEFVSDMVKLGDLFRVHRGTVTGNNRVFIEGQYEGEIPERFLRPTVTRAMDLFSAEGELSHSQISKLKRVIDIPAVLEDLDDSEMEQVSRFLSWARSRGAADSYTARARKAWWSVGLRQSASILCTYMGRRPPAFVFNQIMAPHINIAHGLYPRQPMPDELLQLYAQYLSQNVSVKQGRTYAGGLVKFEPKELENIFVPRPEDLHAKST